MECPKCKSTAVRLVRDKRGIPEARCETCDSFIKKMSTGEVIDYYEQKLGAGDVAGYCVQGHGVALDEYLKDAVLDKAPCRFCTEHYFTRRGRLGTVYYPVEAKFCPMCGRELKDSDRIY